MIRLYGIVSINEQMELMVLQRISKKNFGFIFCFGVMLFSVLAWSVADSRVASAAAAEKVLGESFADEFNGQDTTLWQKSDGWTNGGMFNCGWVGDHVSFGNGLMQLNLDNTASFGRPFTSGEYRTVNFYQYGTFEVRMKAAKGSGVDSSFFTYTGPSDNQPWDEIDIEFLGKDPSKMQTNYFTNGQGNHEALINLGFDASADFHVYKIVWMPKRIEWYVDGKLVHKESGYGLPTHPQKIMMNLWPGVNVDGWLGHFTYQAPVTAQYDWVHYTKLDPNQTAK